jgi:glycosyltransferase involved in cell wall biosynthesis
VNVAILILDIVNLSSAGGAERFFSDLFEEYNGQSNPKRKLFFISDDFSNLQKINKLGKFKDQQITLRSYRDRGFKKFTSRIAWLDNFASTIRDYYTMKGLLKDLKRFNIKAIHMPIYEDRHFHLIKWLDMLPANDRPKIIVNITNAVVPLHYFSTDIKNRYHSILNYGRLFNKINVDGVYTWYELFKKFAEENKIIKSKPLISAISSRFTSTEFFEDFNGRENRMIFSGRFSIYKDPLMFVNAVKIVNDKMPGHGWKFEMYGKGQLEEESRNFINKHKLNDVLTISHHPHMAEILRKSKVYVSTQNVENFPSLAMAEAMACRNLIIARNVGQTDLYVKDNVNGFIIKEDTVESLASTMLDVIKNPERIESMSLDSIKLLKNVHNKENFIKEIDAFWDQLNNRK